MKSVEEIRTEVHILADKICYDMNISAPYCEVVNRAWNLVDVGYREDSIVDGRCSLQESMDFNINTWETTIKADIKAFTEFIEKNKS